MKAVIFDMDGLLIDSERHWLLCDKKVWGALGIEVTEEFIDKLTGLNLRDGYAVARQYKPDLSWKAMQEQNAKVATVIYTEMTELMPGVIELLQNAKDNNLRIGLASSTSLDWINVVLQRFNLDHFFKVKLSTHSMGLPGKPKPDVYLEAMRQLGVDPQETVVFEDSIHGVTAAKQAGAFTVAVPNPEWNKGDYSIADVVLRSLADFDFSLIK